MTGLLRYVSYGETYRKSSSSLSVVEPKTLAVPSSWLVGSCLVQRFCVHGTDFRVCHGEVDHFDVF